MSDFAALMTGEPSAAPKSTSTPAYDVDELKGKIRAAAERYGMDPDMAERWANKESRFNPKAISKKKAKGLLQLTDATAAEMGVTDPYDVDQNIEGGFKYWKKQKDKYGDNARAFAAYNAGPDAVDKAGGVPDYAETKDYVNTIVGQPDDMASHATGDDAQASADFIKSFGDPKKFGNAAAMVGEGITPYRGTEGDTLTGPQQKFFEALNKGGGYKPKGPDGAEAPGGTESNPFFIQHGVTEDDAVRTLPPGSYYVTREAGKNGLAELKRTPGGEETGNFGTGLLQGGADVVSSVMGLAPGSQDSTIRNRLLTDAAAYDASSGGKFGPGIGRFLGQVGASVPLLAGAEAAGAPLLARMGPVGSFLAGKLGAGEVAAPTVTGRAGQLALRGGSLAASGAQEGAGAAVLTSSANEQPIGEQIATGALLGGAFKPAAAGLETGMSRFFGPSMKGAAPATEQQALAERAASLPHPVSLDAGQLSRAPAASGAVNDILRGAEGDLPAKVVQSFRQEQQQQLRGNVQAISDAIAGRPVQPGEGARAVSDTLNARRDAMKASIDAAYAKARANGESAQLATATDLREGMLDGLRRGYNEGKIGNVLTEVEKIGSDGAPTARGLFETRERLGGLSMSSDPVEAAAARTAKRGLDDYIKTALKNDLFLGDPKAIAAWKDAIGKRAEFGKLFEGDDLIEGLTERTSRGGEHNTLKVDPEEAVNYILGRDNLGFATKQNLTRDLFRLRTVLGPKSAEWDGLRSEVFMRLARAGEGAPEAGAAPQFSGQNFAKAWNALNTKNPRLVEGMFTQDERDLINKFADVAQAATTSVKGGDQVSNTAITGKRMLQRVMQFVTMAGGASGGAALGGVPGAAAGAAFGALMRDFGEVFGMRKARNLTYGAKPVANDAGLNTKLLTPAVAGSAITGNRIVGEQQPPPKAR